MLALDELEAGELVEGASGSLVLVGARLVVVGRETTGGDDELEVASSLELEHAPSASGLVAMTSNAAIFFMATCAPFGSETLTVRRFRLTA